MKAGFWRRTAVSMLMLMVGSLVVFGAIPHLAKKGDAAQLIVDGKPFVMLSGELHNSSSTDLRYMESVWPRLKALNLNTVIAAVSWELVEPKEGTYDFALVKGIIDQAREHDMRLVLLWFGSWKNGVSSYVPGWVKKDTKRFKRALGSSNGNTKDVLSPLCKANQDADAKAFAAFMRYLKKYDSKKQTVIMVQVENEVGMRPESRDLSPMANEAFASAVPGEFMAYLKEHKEELLPRLKAVWEKSGFREAGTWAEVFGSGWEADEVFSVWHYGKYINAVAAAGKAEYALPMYVNAWLVGPGQKAGQYPSGGPVAGMLDVWRASGSAIDFYAPDIYLPTFKEICAAYTRSGNPLMIPEARTDEEMVARAFWAFCEHDALCFAPFGIDHVEVGNRLAQGYDVLSQILPLICEAHGTDRMFGIYRQDKEKTRPDCEVIVGDYKADVEYIGWGVEKESPRYGVIIQTGADEFIVAGWGFKVRFSALSAGPRYTQILSVEQGHFEDGKWVYEQQLNGDETEANNRAVIPPNYRNTAVDINQPRILKVKVYRHD